MPLNRRKFLQTVASLPASGLGALAAGAPSHLGPAGLDVDFESYLSSHDIVYLSPAEEGYEAFPLGNGDQGGMLWTPGGDLCWALNKSDAWDDKPGFEPGNQTDLVSCGLLKVHSLPVFDWMYLEDYRARLRLYDATARIQAKSAFGETSTEAFCSARHKSFCLRMTDSLSERVSRRIELSRFGSRSLDLLITKPGTYSGDASQRLSGITAGVDKGGVWVHQKLSGLSFAVYAELDGIAYRPTRTSSRSAVLETDPLSKANYTLYASVVTSEDASDPLQQAKENVRHAKSEGWDRLHAVHRNEWARFWSKSFVHIPEDYLENLWYLNLYQLNSCSRGRYAPLFSGGLWQWNHDVRQWGGRYYHWNEQGVFWPVHAANHPELAEPYYRTYFPMLGGARASARRSHHLDGAFFSDIANRSGEQLDKSESLTCNLTPGMQIALDFWRHYEYTRDYEFLRTRALPFLEDSVKFYLGILRRDKDGLYFVPSSCAYETPLPGDEKRLRNATPDLASIRAGFKAYVRAVRIVGAKTDVADQCDDVLSHFPAFATFRDPQRGEVFGRGHLPDGRVATDPVFRPDQSPVFPAGEIGLEQQDSREFQIAVRTWRPGNRGEIGIWPEGVVAARLGMADESAKELAVRADQLQIFPQGFFTDMGMRNLRFYAHNQSDGPPLRGWEARPLTSGVRGEPRPLPVKSITQPFLESAGIFATTLQEMLLQSYAGKIRVFPAVPSDWATGFSLRAVGGFLVTSERQMGEILYILIESLAGEDCVVVNPWKGRYRVRKKRRDTILIGDGNEIRFPTSKGVHYLIERADRPVESFTRVTFKRSANQAPKTFGQSILGRIRNF